MHAALAAGLGLIPFHPPADFNSIYLIVLRWVHFLAGITWIGLLYFFNLVNVPFMKELDGATKGKVIPSLMPKALWWFRWGAVVTVLAGLLYWENSIRGNVAYLHSNGVTQASEGMVLGTFFAIWIGAWLIEYILLSPVKGALNNGKVLWVLILILVTAAAWLFLRFNSNVEYANNVLAIGVGGGLGMVMLLNVWGIIWRNNKKTIAWTKANAADGTPVPPESAKLARQAFLASRTNTWLSVALLFFMAAASHYALFGK